MLLMSLTQPTEADMETLGALVGKCLLEGVVLPVELAAAVLCFVLDERQLTADQLIGIAHHCHYLPVVVASLTGDVWLHTRVSPSFSASRRNKDSTLACVFEKLAIKAKVNRYTLLCAGGGVIAGGLWASADELLTVLSAHDGELARQWRTLLHDTDGMHTSMRTNKMRTCAHTLAYTCI